MGKFYSCYFVISLVISALFIFKGIPKAMADKIPPVGERVYYGGQDGSLRIKTKSKNGNKAGSSPVMFRDPQLGPGFEDESPKTTITIEDESQQDLEKVPAVGARKRKPAVEKQVSPRREVVVESEVPDSPKKKKSILDMGALKISGRHKEPTIPFSKIPIHIEQTHEPLRKRFLDKIDDNLPGL